MKKFLLITTILFTLSSCKFQSREDFEKELEANELLDSSDIDMPKIRYISADSNEDINFKSEEGGSEDKQDFDSMYGEGKFGKNMTPQDSQGSIIDTKLGESQIGISLMPSTQSLGGYSSILSYKKNNELVEREFGPVAGMENLATMVAYDKIDAESGPMLLASQVTVNNGQTYSAYYLFNRYMSLMDYLVFRNSTDNIVPSVERLGEMVETPDISNPGDIYQAIESRKEIEDRYLKSLLDVYKVKSRPVKSLVEGREIEIGYLPDTTDDNRIILLKSTSNPDNMGMNIDIEN